MRLEESVVLFKKIFYEVFLRKSRLVPENYVQKTNILLIMDTPARLVHCAHTVLCQILW